VDSFLKALLTDLLDADPEFSDELLAMREFMYAQGPFIVGEIIARDLPSTLQPQVEEVDAFIRSLFPEAIDILLERFQNASQNTTSRQPETVALTGQPTLHERYSDSGYSTTSLEDRENTSHPSVRHFDQAPRSLPLHSPPDSQLQHHDTFFDVLRDFPSDNLDILEPPNNPPSVPEFQSTMAFMDLEGNSSLNAHFAPLAGSSIDF
jgi:hypothetical protein